MNSVLENIKGTFIIMWTVTAVKSSAAWRAFIAAFSLLLLNVFQGEGGIYVYFRLFILKLF